jgi:glycopeptide antibiotics resistance protein
MKVRPPVIVATIAYLLGLLALLLAPLNIVRYHTRLWELSGRYLGLGWTAGREQVLDAAVNVALFVPLGFLIHRWWRRSSRPSRQTVWRTLGVAAVLASGVEAIQIFLPPRHASLLDLVSDVAGACVGVGLDSALAWIAARSTRPRPET